VRRYPATSSQHPGQRQRHGDVRHGDVRHGDVRHGDVRQLNDEWRKERSRTPARQRLFRSHKHRDMHRGGEAQLTWFARPAPNRTSHQRREKCTEPYTGTIFQTHSKLLDCNAHSKLLDCNAHSKLLDCNAHSKLLDCNAHSKWLNSNAHSKLLDCSAHSKWLD
jgi:hypothetical protein